ncbi:MAG: MBL fold metallo-hydrolase [Henriciella sp.]|nr:MBL fold metallo-hydrolase [Henriciella sp.]
MRLWGRRLLIGALVLLVMAFVGFQLFKKQISWSLFTRVMETRLTDDPVQELSDGLHVYMCGTGSPMPSQRAGACMGVLAGERGFIVDSGDGGWANLLQMGFPVGELEAVYLTHLHSDHIDGLGGLMLQAWVGGGRREPLPIRGPVGTADVVAGFNAAYRIDSTYRTAHHGPDIADPGGFGGRAEEIDLPIGPGGREIILDEGDLTITAFAVDHSPVEPAMGFRIDYKDRSISISGDTIYDQRLIGASRDVDVLFHEALQPRMVKAMQEMAEQVGNKRIATIFHDILDYHTSPEDAAKAASEAGAGQLILYHVVPPLPTRLLYPTFLGDAGKAFDGKITVSEDGMRVSLPAGTDRVTVTQLMR